MAPKIDDKIKRRRINLEDINAVVETRQKFAPSESTRTVQTPIPKVDVEQLAKDLSTDEDINSYSYDNSNILISLSQQNVARKRKELEEELSKLTPKQLQELIYDYSTPLLSTPKGKTKTKQVQELLLSKGYSVGKTGADGILGKNTKKAIEQYNKDKFIDGIIGPRTLAAKENYLNSVREQSPYTQQDLSTCGIEGCAQYVTKKYEQVNGVRTSMEDGVILDAWNMPKQIEAMGGGYAI